MSDQPKRAKFFMFVIGRKSERDMLFSRSLSKPTVPPGWTILKLVGRFYANV